MLRIVSSPRLNAWFLAIQRPKLIKNGKANGHSEMKAVYRDTLLVFRSVYRNISNFYVNLTQQQDQKSLEFCT